MATYPVNLKLTSEQIVTLKQILEDDRNQMVASMSLLHASAEEKEEAEQRAAHASDILMQL